MYRMQIFTSNNGASNNYSLDDLEQWGKMKKNYTGRIGKKETNARGVINKNAKCR